MRWQVGTTAIGTGFACVALLGLAACGGSAGSSSAGSSNAKAPVVVGYEVPLTGTVAADGRQEEQGWNLGLKDFGSSVDGHPVVTHFVDTQGDPTIALSSAKQLVEQDHINVLEGPLLANEVAAVASYVDPLKIPVDDLTLCSAPQLSDYPKYGNGLSSGWSCDQPDLIAAQYLYQVKGYRHVTVLANDYAFGWESAGSFIKEFTRLGGKIDKVLWPPTTTTDWSPYVSGIPRNTQAVFAETVGEGGPDFTRAYATFGLRGQIPLYGNTTLFDYSVLPAEPTSAVLGDEMAAQYCDGIDNPANKKFTQEYFTAYHTYPGYYAEAGYTKARLLTAALATLHGDASNKAAVAKALRSTTINAPRGPVRLSPATFSPIQNIYICKVEMVSGRPRDVPVKTYPSVQPWANLPQPLWRSTFVTDALGRPST